MTAEPEIRIQNTRISFVRIISAVASVEPLPGTYRILSVNLIICVSAPIRLQEAQQSAPYIPFSVRIPFLLPSYPRSSASVESCRPMSVSQAFIVYGNQKPVHAGASSSGNRFSHKPGFLPDMLTAVYAMKPCAGFMLPDHHPSVRHCHTHICPGKFPSVYSLFLPASRKYHDCIFSQLTKVRPCQSRTYTFRCFRACFHVFQSLLSNGKPVDTPRILQMRLQHTLRTAPPWLPCSRFQGTPLKTGLSEVYSIPGTGHRRRSS